MPESIGRATGDPQAEPEALFHPVKLLKFTEDSLYLACRNSIAAIVNVNPDFVGTPSTSNKNASMICIFHCVANKVVQNCQKAPRVAHDRYITWTDAQPNLFVSCPSRPMLPNFLQKIGHRNGFQLRSESSIMHTRCFDQCIQMLD